MLDTIPGVILVRTKVWNREAVIVCFLLFTQYQWYSSILYDTEVRFPRGGILHDRGKWESKGPGVIPGRVGWRPSSGGEPSVPGKISGGVARGPIPGSSGSTLSGVPTVNGEIPGGMASHPTPAGQQSGVVSSISSSIPGQVVVFVYNRG